LGYLQKLGIGRKAKRTKISTGPSAGSKSGLASLVEILEGEEIKDAGHICQHLLTNRLQVEREGCSLPAQDRRLIINFCTWMSREDSEGRSEVRRRGGGTAQWRLGLGGGCGSNDDTRLSRQARK